MNNYNSYNNLRKKSSASALAIVLSVLIILEMCSLAVLFSRMAMWVDRESSNILPLTESTDLTKIRVGEMGKDGTLVFFDNDQMTIDPLPQANALYLENGEARPAFSIPETLHSSDSVAVLDNETNGPASNNGGNSDDEVIKVPGFEVYDDDTVWSASTDVEIFKFSYVNGENKVTVAGDRSDKLIAPGTSNTYSFTLKNTGNVSLNYRLSMEAYITGTDISIPVVVRVIGHDGSYCMGSEDKWADVHTLNALLEEGTLASDRYANYTLEWMWPFEGDDEYDTMLGDLASEGDVSLTIAIKTLAAQSEDPDDPGDNPPQTGDSTASVVFWAVVSLTILVTILALGKKRSRRYFNE